eukprot:m.199804 g.199804  ORF g.199804 m.199804 type:complete len:74 (+) comp39576_c0_seq4:334-555(+)
MQPSASIQPGMQYPPKVYVLSSHGVVPASSLQVPATQSSAVPQAPAQERFFENKVNISGSRKQAGKNLRLEKL